MRKNLFSPSSPTNQNYYWTANWVELQALINWFWFIGLEFLMFCAITMSLVTEPSFFTEILLKVILQFKVIACGQEPLCDIL